jgi:hypothetical protein
MTAGASAIDCHSTQYAISEAAHCITAADKVNHPEKPLQKRAGLTSQVGQDMSRAEWKNQLKLIYLVLLGFTL